MLRHFEPASDLGEGECLLPLPSHNRRTLSLRPGGGPALDAIGRGLGRSRRRSQSRGGS